MLNLKQPEDITSFDSVKGNIIVMARSKSFLERHEDIPYIMKGDIALTFDIAIPSGDDESFLGGLVNNDLLEIWGTDKETLYEVALKNTEKVFPAEIKSLEGFLSGILPNVADKESHAIVITNEHCIGGSAALFYEGIMERVAAEIGGSYFILPSSVHEVIALPDRGEDYADLEKMVGEVNAMIISDSKGDDRDILSYRVHRYDVESGRFELASSWARRKAS